MTWSIVARDSTGQFGVAVASKFFAVGALCAHTRRGVGVLSTQALMNPLYGASCLALLGLGQQPPAPSWGSMLNTAKNYIDNAPWMAIWPGLSIFLLVLSFNLLGDGLRDALDPRQR